MAVSRVSCPHCDAVLKPAKPVPVGTKVKCPKCKEAFTVTGAAPEAAAPKAGAARKAARPAPKPAPEPEPPKPADDDDDVGTYAVIGDDKPKTADGEDEEDEEEGRPNIEYAPDMSIKDLRGPAMEAIVRPSNFLIFIGIISFLGFMGFLVVVLIPILLPVEDPNAPAEGEAPTGGLVQSLGDLVGRAAMPNFPGGAGDQKKAAAEKPGLSFFQICELNIRELPEDEGWKLTTLLITIVLGAVYAGVLTYGAVKAQNLESRTWGLAASIMAMIPFLILGLWAFIGILVQVLLRMIFDEESTVIYILLGFASMFWLAGLGIGLWNLMTFIKPEVIEGFEYVPE